MTPSVVPTASTRGDDAPFAFLADSAGRPVDGGDGLGPVELERLRTDGVAVAARGGAVLAATPVPAGWAVVGSRVDGVEPDASARALRAAFAAGVAARGAPPRGASAVAELLGAVERRLAGLEGLRRETRFVEELAESIRLFALNAILAAHRLRDSAAIGAVAGLMKTRSDAVGPDLLALGAELDAAVAALEATVFRVAVGRVQAEALGDAPWLGEALAVELEAVVDAGTALDEALDAVAARSRTVAEHFRTLRFLELQGRIEAARAEDTEHVRGLFAEIGAQVRAAGEELKALADLASPRGRPGADVAREGRRLAAALRTSRSASQTSHGLR